MYHELVVRYEIMDPLRIGDNVGVRLPGGEIKYFRIVNRDRLFHRENLASVAASSSNDYTSVSNMIPSYDQLYHVTKLFIERGNVRILVRQPGSTQRWNTQKSATTAWVSDMYDDFDIDMWVMQDYEPSLRVENITPVAHIPRVKFVGWKYQLQTLTAKPSVFMMVSTGGLGQ